MITQIAPNSKLFNPAIMWKKLMLVELTEATMRNYKRKFRTGLPMVLLTLMQVVLTIQAIQHHKVNILHWLYFEYQVWTSLNASTTVECIDVSMH
jgi:hypothetical protein